MRKYSEDIAITVTSSKRAPIVREIVAAPNPALEMTPVTITVDAIDPDQNPLSCGWSDPCGTTSGNGKTATYTSPHILQQATFTVAVAVSDGNGGKAYANVTVTVTPAASFAFSASPAKVF